MKQAQKIVNVRSNGPGLYCVTEQVRRFIEHERVTLGLVTCFIRHTSASLIIQENADPDVLADLQEFMLRLVSRDKGLYRHTTEGPDDMPSHIRAMLTSASIAVPVRDGRLCLGTWQDIYVFEHRDAPRTREIVLHFVGE